MEATVVWPQTLTRTLTITQMEATVVWPLASTGGGANGRPPSASSIMTTSAFSSAWRGATRPRPRQWLALPRS